MANVHYFKRSHNEAVVKVYVTDAAGGTVDVALSDLATPDETFDCNSQVLAFLTSNTHMNFYIF